jgi:hypothetical protein
MQAEVGNSWKPRCEHRYHIAETLVDSSTKIVHVLCICINCSDLQVKRADLSENKNKE